MGYSYQLDKEDEKKTAKAFGKEIDISPKKANEVCYTIKGMNVDKAITYLENVTKMKAFVPMRRYNKNVGHRKGGIPGRYPIKVAKRVIQILKNAKANAEHKGLNDERLKIEHATAYKALSVPRLKPRNWIANYALRDRDFTNVEIIVREV